MIKTKHKILMEHFISILESILKSNFLKSFYNEFINYEIKRRRKALEFTRIK